jgi:hypothetical protein
MLSPDVLGLLGLSSVFFMIHKEAYEFFQKYKEGASKRQIEFAEWKLKKELALIERKYRYVNDPVSKQKERDELIQYADKVKKHLAVENWKEIPTDPEQQTEIQKIIMSTPPYPKSFDNFKRFAETVVQDPETGMYWSKISGKPTEPPEWHKDTIEHQMHEQYPYDYSRGWFYNFLNNLFVGANE